MLYVIIIILNSNLVRARSRRTILAKEFEEVDEKSLSDALESYETIFADPRLVVTNIFQHSNYHLNTDNI